MLTGLFKDRTRSRSSVIQTPDDVLAILLRSKSLRPHRFIRRREIGPFVVAHVCAERALIIDLSRSRPTCESRHVFLQSLGYRILRISPRDVLTRPDSVIAQVREALK